MGREMTETTIDYSHYFWEGKRTRLRPYRPEDVWTIRAGPHFNDVGYGYHWCSVGAGEHQYNFAWGHGGQQIVLLDEYDMVTVLTADLLYGERGDQPWNHERANLDPIADFIASMPSE
jgi:CubicO group peptidase (beta-lactamase class C family)